MAKGKCKTLIIGLDGATFDIINPWLRQGELPTLANLVKNGCYGFLQTVFPPLTAPAWSSFLTGKNPGKHGIYDFLYRENDKYSTVPNSRLTRRAKDFWEFFNAHGLSTGLINIPMTYPPGRVRGYMLTGIMTPRGESAENINYTYPESLKYEIRDKCGNYIIHPKVPYRKGKAKEVYDDLVADLRIKSKTIRYLMEEYPTDLTMFVIGGTDKILHDLYHLIDPKHFRYDYNEAENDKNLVLDYYKKVDSEIGSIIEDFCNSDTLVVIMSDHGSGPVYKWVYLNNWLLKEGYLMLKKNPYVLAKHFLFMLGITPVNIYQLLSKFGFSKSVLSFQEREKLINRFFLSWDDIDWGKTRAYSQGHIGQIYINKKGREPQGIVTENRYDSLRKEIEDRLLTLRDGNGIKVVEKILNKKEQYHGKFQDRSADIIFMPHRLEYIALGTSAFASHRVIEHSFGNTGDHRMNGMFIMRGKGIKKNCLIEGATIVDVVPNLLFYNNLEIDSDMDGRILKQMYEEEFFYAKKPVYKEIKGQIREAGSDDRGDGYSHQDVESVKKALRNLGYLG